MNWLTNIDRMADNAQRARCHIAGLVSHHIRSMAQLRRDRAAEKLSKQQGERK